MKTKTWSHVYSFDFHTKFPYYKLQMWYTMNIVEETTAYSCMVFHENQYLAKASVKIYFKNFNLSVMQYHFHIKQYMYVLLNSLYMLYLKLSLSKQDGCTLRLNSHPEARCFSSTLAVICISMLRTVETFLSYR